MQESDSLVLFIFAAAAAAAAAVAAILLAVGVALMSIFEGGAAAGLQPFALEQEIRSADDGASSGYASVQPSPDSNALPDYVFNHPDLNALVPELLQYPTLSGGCEVVSMTSTLQALGFDIDPVRFTEDYVMPVSVEPPLAFSYSGSPYINGAAFPPAMVFAGNNFLRDQESSWRFVERKHASLTKLLHVVETGRPVLVWTTMYMAQPLYTGIVVEGYEWYDNEHCVVLYGSTAEGTLLVMDPLEGFVERDRTRFEEIYDSCGQHSASLTQVDTEAIDLREMEAQNGEKENGTA